MRSDALDPRPGQGGDGSQQLLAVAEGDAELHQVGLGQLGQHLDVDILGGEGLGIAVEAYALQPALYGTHAAIALCLGRGAAVRRRSNPLPRSEEHTSELQSLMRISYAVFCLKKKIK